MFTAVVVVLVYGPYYPRENVLSETEHGNWFKILFSARGTHTPIDNANYRLHFA